MPLHGPHHSAVNLKIIIFSGLLLSSKDLKLSSDMSSITGLY